MWKIGWSLSAVVLGLVLLASEVHAEGKKACSADRAKYCGGIEKGEGRVRKCLEEHSEELSEECKKHLASRKGERKERSARKEGRGLRKACQDDLAKHCESAKGSRKKARACLAEHEAELSSACKEKLKEFRSRKANKKSADKDDAG